jgi:ribonuclease M5
MMTGYIVEGKSDCEKVMNVVPDAHFVILNGVSFRQKERRAIEEAITICQEVFILTDPDEAGDKIAKKIMDTYPGIKRIRIDPSRAKNSRESRCRYGVEYCSDQYLRETLPGAN